MAILIADSGATKCEWCLKDSTQKTSVFTQGMSAYFLTDRQLQDIVLTELFPKLEKQEPEAIYFYGTGNKNPENSKRIRNVLKKIFPGSAVTVDHDLLGAARALCQHDQGVAGILGTGSNSCFYNGRKVVKNSPGIGYILGDEGSGAYLGRKVIQYYLYNTFEKELAEKFTAKYQTDAAGILENVYQKPLANRYLASFTVFLSENRGQYMIENIIEDGLNDFFSHHLTQYKESSKYPVHFTGGVSWIFKDVVLSLCDAYGFEPGTISKNPMEGLLKFHQ